MTLPDRWNPRLWLRDWLSKPTTSELRARRAVAEVIDAMKDSIAASALARDTSLSAAITRIEPTPAAALDPEITAKWDSGEYGRSEEHVAIAPASDGPVPLAGQRLTAIEVRLPAGATVCAGSGGFQVLANRYQVTASDPQLGVAAELADRAAEAARDAAIRRAAVESAAPPSASVSGPLEAAQAIRVGAAGQVEGLTPRSDLRAEERLGPAPRNDGSP